MKRIRYALRLLSQLWGLARTRKVYWMVPLLLALALFAALAFVAETSSPFVYTLF